VDPVRLGRQIRALRRRRRWRQVDLAAAARVSRSTVSRVELGAADELTIRTVDAIIRALSARLELRVSWNGEGLDRLLDADHAALVETVANVLRSFGWEVAVEVSFNIRGERGSIDILAFHPATRTILVIEVKSVVPDVQATLVVLDRKTRLATEIARQRGWIGRGVGRILVVADRRTARRRVTAHETVFRSAFPDRATSVKRWIRWPDPTRPISGLWFLSDARQEGARQRVDRPRAQPRAH
jgi:transcriptional regulator with XRE-family HTH domain